jgi:hypothetical protein
MTAQPHNTPVDEQSLTDEQRQKRDNIVASWAMEGQQLTDEEVTAVGEIIAGRATADEVIAQFGPVVGRPLPR